MDLKKYIYRKRSFRTTIQFKVEFNNISTLFNLKRKDIKATTVFFLFVVIFIYFCFVICNKNLSTSFADQINSQRSELNGTVNQIKEKKLLLIFFLLFLVDRFIEFNYCNHILFHLVNDSHDSRLYTNNNYRVFFFVGHSVNI